MNKKLYNLCLIGVFSALCFVSLFLTISVPSPVGQQMIHFGNAITIIVAIIFGPIIGGFSGAIGMTIYDLMNPLYISSAPKTFILKLGIGLIAGFVFKALRKKEFPKIKYFILGSAILFLTIGITTLSANIVTKGIGLINPTEVEIVNNKLNLEGYKNGKYFIEVNNDKYIITIKDDKIISNDLAYDGLIININGDVAKISKTAITFHWASYVFPLILGVFLLVTFFITFKLPYLQLGAIIASIGAVLFNIIGEFVGKFIMQMILGQGFTPSIIKAYVSLPATIINACLCVIIIGITFPSIYHAFKKENE